MTLEREKALLLCTIQNLSFDLLGINYEKFSASARTKDSLVDVMDGIDPNTFYVLVNRDWLLKSSNQTVSYVLLQKIRLIYQVLQIKNLETKVDSLKYIEDENLVRIWQDEMEDPMTPMLTRYIFIDSLAFAKLVFEEIYDDEIAVPKQIIKDVNERMAVIKKSLSDDFEKAIKGYSKTTMFAKMFM